MHTIKYTRYPNNEIRAVHFYAPLKKATPPDSSPCASELPAEGESFPEPSPGESSLDIGLKVETITARPGYGGRAKKTVFGARARNRLLRAGGALDSLGAPASDFVFLTGTVPGGTAAAFRAIADCSALAVKRLKDWVNKRVRSPYDFYVWEFQKRGALHLHYCVYVPDATARAYILKNFKEQWQRVLEAVAVASGTDMWMRRDGSYHRTGKHVLQAYAQVVRKSVAAYLAGYCAGKKSKRSLDNKFGWYPSRWWGMSRGLCALLEKLTEQVVEEFPTYIDARKKIEIYWDRLKLTAPKKYRYPHKVGIGMTVVSYHKFDRGESQWQRIKTGRMNNQDQPKFCCGIQVLRTFARKLHGLMREPPGFGRRWDLQSASASRLYSLTQMYSESMSDRLLISIVMDSTSDLSFNAVAHPLPLELRELFRVVLQWTHRNNSHFKFNQQGMLIEGDALPFEVDKSWENAYARTSDEAQSPPPENLGTTARSEEVFQLSFDIKGAGWSFSFRRQA